MVTTTRAREGARTSHGSVPVSTQYWMYARGWYQIQLYRIELAAIATRPNTNNAGCT